MRAYSRRMGTRQAGAMRVGEGLEIGWLDVPEVHKLEELRTEWTWRDIYVHMGVAFVMGREGGTALPSSCVVQRLSARNLQHHLKGILDGELPVDPNFCDRCTRCDAIT